VYSSFNHYERDRASKAVEVQDPSNAYVNMEPNWILIEDLITGTYGIRKRHRKYLPQMPREQDESYDNRLATSVLAPLYIRIERLLAGMLTRKPVRLNEVSERVTEDLFDVNLQGDDLTSWTFETSKIMLRYGHVGVLVDAPTGGTGRPYWITYSPREILGWRTELVDGQQKLTQLRLLEKVTVPDGDYGEKEVDQVRLLTPGAFEVHQKGKQGKYVKVDEGTTSLDYIPFAIAYANKVGFLESRPPMQDIAELNLLHFQKSSDFDNQLRISAVPMLCLFGFPQASEEVSAGPGEAIAFPEGARAEFVEIKGQSFQYQSQRIKDIEAQINNLALAAILGQKLGVETAASQEIQRSQGDSTLKIVAQQLQDMVDNCLMFHANYLNISEVGNCFINRDFLGTKLAPQEIQAMQGLWASGAISQETLLKQLAEGEILGDDFDVEMEIESTQMGDMPDEEPTPPAEPDEQTEDPEDDD